MAATAVASSSNGTDNCDMEMDNLSTSKVTSNGISRDDDSPNQDQGTEENCDDDEGDEEEEEEEEDDDDEDYDDGGEANSSENQNGVDSDAGMESDDDVPLLERKKELTNNHVKVETKEESEDCDANSKDSGYSNLKRPASEEGSDEDLPLSARAKKLKMEEEDEDYKGSTQTKSKKKKKKHKHNKDKESSKKKHERRKEESNHKKAKHKNDKISTEKVSPTKKRKKEEEEVEIWKWWEETDHGEGVKWQTLQHNGIVFAAPYEPLPPTVKFYYDGQPMTLCPEAEEVATFYAKLIEHEYTTKDIFNTNFFKDWRRVMKSKEREVITDLSKCNFKEINQHFKELSEQRKTMSKEQKEKLKRENAELQKIYGWAEVDGHKQKVGNFRIEPPGLFRGRGDHPKMGMLKKRVLPSDVIINISKGAKIPDPPAGYKWKEIRHDNTVCWLACWTENIMNSQKYVMLNPSSKLKGQKDWEKYEKARQLKQHIKAIREEYREDWKSKEMRIRQRAVALYFIDKLALRAGNEKEEGETADTVGCCSLRVEHIELFDELDGHENVVKFDFLGKDSIQYVNQVSVEKRVFKNLKLFVENKEPGDDLFDRLNTSILNKYLQEKMEGLTAKVFRTYNASITLQEQLNLMTTDDLAGKEAELILAYNRANREVAILCNHQRSVPKSHETQMGNLEQKISDKKKEVKKLKRARDAAKTDYKNNKSVKNQKAKDAAEKRYRSGQEQLKKLEIKRTDKHEGKTIALGTSKLNYLDPRITVQWCLKNKVSINKVYNKTQREKFQWAIDMITKQYSENEEFVF